jgi:hypothetical protein
VGCRPVPVVIMHIHEASDLRRRTLKQFQFLYNFLLVFKLPIYKSNIWQNCVLTYKCRIIFRFFRFHNCIYINFINYIKIHHGGSWLTKRRFWLVLGGFRFEPLPGYRWSRDSSVGTATRYGLHGPEIESRWGGDFFRTCLDRPCGPPSFIYNGYWVFPGGKAAEAWR